jgi:hypothetical protein
VKGRPFTLLVFVAGCELFVRNTETRCKTNKDCESVGICYDGECIAPQGTVEAGLIVEITPPSSLAIASPSQRHALAASNSPTLPWVRPTEWRGRITGPDGVNPIGAFTLTNVEEGTTFSRTTSRNDTADFDIFLHPGTYSVYFRPNPDLRSSGTLGFPEVAVDAWQVTDTNLIDIQIPYPARTQFPRVTGRLRTSRENLLGPSISDALVYATIEGSPLISAASTTDENGNFAFLVGVPTGHITVRIGPSAKNPYVPEIVLPPLALSPPAPGDTTLGDTALGDVFVGEIGNPIAITGTVLTTNGPLVGADVLADLAVGLGVYHSSGLTNARGEFEVVVPRATQALSVALTVRPPAGSSVATVNTVAAVPATGVPPAVSITCPPRALWGGTVVDASGNPTAAVVIRAKPRDSVRYAMVETVTDASGAFTLGLDETPYDVDVIPRPGSRLARTSFALGIGDARLEPLQVSLPRSTLIAGEVSTTQSFKSARLQFFRRTDTRLELLGETLVDANNHFAIALPPPP